MFTSSPRALGYKVVQYIAFRNRGLKEGIDGTHLIACLLFVDRYAWVYDE